MILRMNSYRHERNGSRTMELVLFELISDEFAEKSINVTKRKIIELGLFHKYTRRLRPIRNR